MNPKGYYEIQADLDFTNVSWPLNLSQKEFTGKMYGKDGQTYTISNVSVRHSTEEADKLIGGLFGSIEKGAELKNIRFTNVTFDLNRVKSRLKNASFGMFAGIIDQQADISNVAVDGTLKIGAVTLDASTSSFNLYANGDISKLTKGNVKLVVYGNELGNVYRYTIHPDDATAITVNNTTNDITINFKSLKNYENESYEINYTEVNQDE
jgi:hypothetical protein